MITTPIIVIKTNGQFDLQTSLRAYRQIQTEATEEFEMINDLANQSLEKETNGDSYRSSKHLAMFIFIASEQGKLTIEER